MPITAALVYSRFVTSNTDVARYSTVQPVAGGLARVSSTVLALTITALVMLWAIPLPFFTKKPVTPVFPVAPCNAVPVIRLTVIVITEPLKLALAIRPPRMAVG